MEGRVSALVLCVGVVGLVEGLLVVRLADGGVQV